MLDRAQPKVLYKCYYNGHVGGIEEAKHSSDVAEKHIIAHLIGALRRRMSSCRITKFLESSEVLDIRSICSERHTAPPGSSAEGADTALFLESHFCLQADLSSCE